MSAYATALHNAVSEIFKRTIHTSKKGFFEKMSTTFQHFREKKTIKNFWRKLKRSLIRFFLENAFGSESHVAFFEEALLSFRNNSNID